MIKKTSFLSLFILLFLSGSAMAQEIIDTPIVHDLTPKVYKTFFVSGRVVGMNLETVQGVNIVNKRTGETASTDGSGIYKISAAKTDTLFFKTGKYSMEMRQIKTPGDKMNVIMIKRKTDELPAGHSQSDFNKAQREDNELYRILEKDAKLEGKWVY
jgi:hypothetical protein